MTVCTVLLIFLKIWELNQNNVVYLRVVNGPTSSGPNPARTRKLIWSPNYARTNPKVKLGLKNLAMLPSYFDYIFVRVRRNAPLRPELSPKFLSTLGPNPTRKARPDLQLWSTVTISMENDTYTNKIRNKKSNSCKYISDIAESKFLVISHSKLILIFSTLYFPEP